jgi:hypothetical protein
MTAEQKQMFASYAQDVTITLDDRELPLAIIGRLSPRRFPADSSKEALAVLDGNAAAFRRGPYDDFQVRGVDRDRSGIEHVRMTQTYKGLSVVNRELTVHLSSRDVIGITGQFAADLDFAIDADWINPASAAAAAMSYAQKNNMHNARVVVASPTPAIHIGENEVAQIVIPIDVISDEQGDIKQVTLLVGVTQGQVVGRSAVSLASTGSCGLGCTQLIQNPSFEITDNSWQQSSTAGYGVIDSGCGFQSDRCAWFGGWGKPTRDSIYQEVTIPGTAKQATLSYYLKIMTSEPQNNAQAHDTLSVYAHYFSDPVHGLGSVQSLLNSYSDATPFALNSPFRLGNYVRQSVDVTKFAGRTIGIHCDAVVNGPGDTSFYLDSVLLTVQQ